VGESAASTMGKPATIPKPITRATPARRGPYRASSGVGLTEAPGHVLTPVQFIASSASTNPSQANAPWGSGNDFKSGGYPRDETVAILASKALCHPPHRRRAVEIEWCGSREHSNQESPR